MAALSWRWLMGVALLLEACGDGTANGLSYDGSPATQGIIGGMAASPDQFPATGALLMVQTLAAGGELAGVQCTGTLIGPDVVLVAAHCVDETSALGQVTYYFTFSRDVSTFGQSGNNQLPARTHIVSEYVKHSRFDVTAFVDDFVPGLGTYYDIALAFLEVPVMDVAIASLLRPANAHDLHIGAAVQIVGYGQREAEPGSPLFGEKYFATSVINELGSTEMQIGTVPSLNAQKCHGDSGGPTFMTFGDGFMPPQRLIGITSHTYDDTDCYSGGVDTRVDPYLTWIEVQAIGACARGARTACDGGGSIANPTLADPETPALTNASNCAASTPDVMWVWLGLGLLLLSRRRRARPFND